MLGNISIKNKIFGSSLLFFLITIFAIIGILSKNNISFAESGASIFLIFTFVVWAGLTYFVAKSVTSPIAAFSSEIKKCVDEGTKFNSDFGGSGEIAKLAKVLNNFMESYEEKVKLVEAIARGDMEKIKLTTDKDSFSKAIKMQLEVFSNLTDEIDRLIESSNEGRLQDRANPDLFEGEWKDLIKGINQIIDAALLPIADGIAVLDRMAKGDFTVRVTQEYKGEHQRIKESINQLGDSVQQLIGQLTEAIEATASASTEISSSAEQMAAGAQEQSAQTGEISAAVEQMAATIVQSAKSASEAAEMAKNAENNAREGGNVITTAMQEINNIANVVSEASVFVEKLGDSSNRIGEIIQVIDDIADQTNLLALNAAIEEARAGEQGRGFAVVADEVRKLAERTSTATKEIAEMIKQIQQRTDEAVEAMHTGKEETEKGKELMKTASQSLEEIIDGSLKVMEAIEQVAAASEEQSATVQQISKSVEQINLVAQESAAGVEQIARAAEDLNRLTENLQVLVEKFEIHGNREEEYSNYMINGNGTLYNDHDKERKMLNEY